MSDEIRIDVYFDGHFFMCLLKYEDETILDLRLPMLKRLSFKEINDLLLDKTKEDIWKWFYCKLKCTLEKSNSVGIGKGEVLLDDFEIVGNGKDKVVLDNAKDELVSTKSDDDPTQEYIRKRNFDDVSEYDDFQSSPWVKALEFMNNREEIGGGCFGDIESYLKKGKLETIVAIITPCQPNVLGDMNVTLKDPSGTTFGTIHYKMLSFEDGYAKDIKVGSALILRNVTAFCDMSKNYALNITIKNIVKIIKKDEVKELGVRAQGSDSMTYLRILHDEDLAKANEIMNLIKETQKQTRGKYVYIAKVKLDRSLYVLDVEVCGDCSMLVILISI
uniref:Homologous recombination OB-fold protein OB-fold domain-containing protein n=1 Tax=Tanacetum cinerariifolium TaxID=118510 RepID=A0A699H880_TANCI|nr:hypothetical protein [Tanacetum cinerariifolium]